VYVLRLVKGVLVFVTEAPFVLRRGEDGAPAPPAAAARAGASRRLDGVKKVLTTGCKGTNTTAVAAGLEHGG